MLRVPLLQVIAVMQQRSSPGAHDGAIQPAVEEVAGGAVHHGPVRGEPRSATPASALSTADAVPHFRAAFRRPADAEPHSGRRTWRGCLEAQPGGRLRKP